MIIVIQNTETKHTTILQNVHISEIELEENEIILSTQYETYESIHSDDYYGSRPGENGIHDYELNTEYSERQSDLYENFMNEY